MSIVRRSACSLVLAVAAAVVLPAVAQAGTTVRFDTILGPLEVDLYDESMPTTVANFLAYVTAGSYDSTFFHRSTTYNPADIQIVQGGGFTISGNVISPVTTNPPIVFESGTFTNLRGTIAMARGVELDTATSQFYFNVQDNPALNGNYAVFGKVANGESLAVLDAIGALPVANLSGQLGPVFAETPLIVVDNTGYFVTVSRVQAVPEPSTMALAAIGLAAAVVVRRRQPGRN